MKKTLFAFMALATAFGATSCQSDEELTQQPTGKPMVINAVAEGIGTKTRAEMAYKYDILWSENDEIYVAGNSKNATFTLQDGDGTTEGTFACTLSPFENGDEVEAFYPASLVDDGSLVWPAEQTANTVIPMYSKQTLGSTGTENFSFASLGAMLQIVFTTPQADVTLKSITLKDDAATMSGTFTVDEKGKAGITATDKAGITLDLGTGVPVGLAAKYFNIAVPAATYSNLTITFIGTDNSTCTLKGSVTLDHNTVGRLTLTGKEFKKFGQGKAYATGPDCDVNWVQLWENGPKFAEYNVGAESAAEYGGYYCWGSSINKDPEEAYKSGTDALTRTNDTATALWGSKWRMPTSDEFSGLLSNCDSEWTTVEGLKGRKYTGRGSYSSNSIFLPAAGYYAFGNSLYSKDSGGNYWSSTPDVNNATKAYQVNFSSYGPNDHRVKTDERKWGYSVRAVLNESVN